MSESISYFLDTIKSYYAQAHHISGYIVNILLVLEFAFFGLKMALGEISSLSAIIKKICVIGAWIYLAKNIDVLSEAFVRTLTKMSMSLGDNTSTIDFLSNPMEILEFNYDVLLQYIIDDLIESAKSIKFWKGGAIINTVIIFILFLAVSVSSVLIALIVLIIQIEFYMIVLCAILLFPFMLNEKTKFISEKIIPSIAGQGIKLMIVGIVVQITLQGYMHIFQNFKESDSIGMKDTLYIITIVALGLFVIIQSQRYAQALISGMPDTNFAQQAMSMGASAMMAYKIVKTGKELGGVSSDKNKDSKDIDKENGYMDRKNNMRAGVGSLPQGKAPKQISYKRGE